MKKTVILGLAVCLIVGLTACKKDEYAALGKYAEIGPVMDTMIKATEVYIADLDKATTADQIAAAMDVITEKMTALAPKMKAIGEKFPEFKSQENPPTELKPFNDRLEGMMGKMMGVMTKIAPFASDPKVMAAQERYNKAMADTR
jgi:hypothetical protein